MVASPQSRSERFRIAVLGCGRVAKRYREIFSDDLKTEVEVVAVSDPLPEAMEQFAAHFGAKTCSDRSGIVDAKPDFVCILSKSGDHADDARFFLEAGIGVVVEKPIALRPEQVVPLISLARDKGLVYAVVQQNRYNPAILKIREAIQEGRFGKLVLAGVRVHWSRPPAYYQDGWHGTWAMDGGILAQQAIHHLDALQWLAGPIEAVCAYGDHLVNPAEAEDTAAVLVRFKSGAMGTVEATTAARPRDFEASLTIVGEGGTAKIGGIALNEIQTWEFAAPKSGDDRVAKEFSQAVPSGMGLGHAAYFRDLFATLRRGDIRAPVDATQGLHSLRFVHAIYASMEQEGWVRMDEQPTSSRLGRVAKVIEHIRSRP